MLARNIENSLRGIIRNSPVAPVLRKYFRRSQIEEVLDVGRKQGWEYAANWIITGQGARFIQSDEFHRIFRNTINTNIEYEYLLTEIRKQLLLSGFEELLDSGQSTLLGTLILQAHHNEFVWYISDEEKTRIDAIVAQLQSEDQVSLQVTSDLILLSMYGRVGQIDNLPLEKHRMLVLNKANELPLELEEILVGSIVEYDELQEIKTNIKQLGHIENQTSNQIAQNYEEHPYPRWINWDFPETGMRIKKLQEFYSLDELHFTSRPFDVLIAGCGTGSKAIECAIGYGDNVKITAIDLSRTSLSYAIYMAKKYNIRNIEFMQMDLLELPKLNKTFDIVECTGVLHHMRDPIEGGKAIIERVKSKGLVHISLYSELARASIVELRERYGLTPDMSNDEIRSMRMLIMKSDAELLNEGLSLRWDFFDLHRCKDLLFHPLEHRYSIPKIQEMLAMLNLDFRGLEKPDILRSQYWTRYPSQNDLCSFHKWHEFELRHPDAFGNLYEIWALK